MPVQTQLSPEQVAFYRDYGYLQIPEFFTPAETADIKTRMLHAIDHFEQVEAERAARGELPASRAVYRDTAYTRILQQKINLWLVDEEIRPVVFDNRLAEVVRQATRSPRVRLFHDHALIKMPGDSRPTPWHQDTVYWPTEENGGVSLWIALDDVDENNGCLAYIPKSRGLGRLPAQDFFDPRDLLKMVVRGEALEEVQPMVMRAGGIVLHDGLTLHYAFPNHSDKPRHALAIVYMVDGTHYNGKEHPVTDGQGLAPGDLIAGTLFPVLAEAE